MIIYISGPMTGLPEYNYPAFFRAAEELTVQNHIPLNPAVVPVGLAYPAYMDIACAMVRASQGMLLLPGWEDSKGARVEHALAVSLGLPILTYEQFKKEHKPCESTSNSWNLSTRL